MASLMLAGAAAPLALAAPEATIVRDSRGEPHISGPSAEAAIYGFAYAQMQDQAPYILALISHATGRSAELSGASCTPSLQACFSQDQLSHLFRVPETAYARFASLPADTRSRFVAFADGINAYVDSHAANLPAWAQHVTPQDVLAEVEYGFVFSEVGQLTKILAGGAAAASAGTFAQSTPDLGSTASNMFVVAGSKTASGKPIVEGNPHLGWTGVDQWYAAQLSYPGHRIRGFTFRGLPGIAVGSNDHVAWANTANHGTQHEQDAYTEKLNPANRDQYLYGGSYRDMEVRHISVKVKQATGQVQSIPVMLRYTLHGPVFSDPTASTTGTQAAPGATTATAAMVSQYGQAELATQIWRESEASSVSEFKAAMALNQLSTYNMTVGDDAGNIFYVASSRSGILKPGRRFNTVFDGSDPNNDWQGIVPFAQLPQANNPVSGYYENANNAPWYTAPDQIIKSNYPFYLQGGGDTTRSRRQIQLLGSQTSLGAPTNLTIPDSERFGFDSYLETGASLRALLDQTAATPGPVPADNAKVQEAATLIDGWDLRADKASTEFPLFVTWAAGMRPATLKFNIANPPPAGTTFTSTQKDEARRAIVVAYNGMKAHYNGRIAVPYGEVHTVTRGNFTAPISGGDEDLSSPFLVHCNGAGGGSNGVYYRPCPTVDAGTSLAYNVPLGEERMTIARPVSDTDDPASPFYTLNTRDFAAERTRDFPISDSAISGEATSTQTKAMPGAGVMSLSPTALDFGAQTQGTSSASRQATVANTGSGYLYLGSSSIGGDGAASFVLGSDGCSQSAVAPGGSCAFGVSFAPRGPGSTSAALVIPTATSFGAVSLSGTGIAHPPPPPPPAPKPPPVKPKPRLWHLVMSALQPRGRVTTTVRVTGRLVGTSGRTCSGQVRVAVRFGSKLLRRGYRGVTHSCTFGAAPTFDMRHLGSRYRSRSRTVRLHVSVTYMGNSVLQPSSTATLTVRVRR